MIRKFYSLLAVVAFTISVTAAPQIDATAPIDDDQNVDTENIAEEHTPDSDVLPVDTPAKEPIDLPTLSEEQIKERISSLATRQDELSAIIQDLSWKWTNKEIAKFLEEVDFALLDARDALDNEELGGDTIAAQNDAIEKIYQAAKKNQQSSGSQSDSLGAMMDQLDYMTGKKSSKSGKGKPGKEGEDGDQPGQGGGSGSEDDGIAQGGRAEKEMLENRTIPKAAGRTPTSIPSEFREGMEALRESLANQPE